MSLAKRVQVQCTILEAWGWCTGTTQRDGMGREEGGGFTEEALQIAVKRRKAKSKGEKERYKHLNAEFQRTARRDRKASSVITVKK